MFKLAMSSKFRDAAKKVLVELQNAGIDLSSKVSPVFSPLAFYRDLPSNLQEAMEELAAFSRWSKK